MFYGAKVKRPSPRIAIWISVRYLDLPVPYPGFGIRSTCDVLGCRRASCTDSRRPVLESRPMLKLFDSFAIVFPYRYRDWYSEWSEGVARASHVARMHTLLWHPGCRRKANTLDAGKRCSGAVSRPTRPFEGPQANITSPPSYSGGSGLPARCTRNRHCLSEKFFLTGTHPLYINSTTPPQIVVEYQAKHPAATGCGVFKRAVWSH